MNKQRQTVDISLINNQLDVTFGEIPFKLMPKIIKDILRYGKIRFILDEETVEDLKRLLK